MLMYIRRNTIVPILVFMIFLFSACGAKKKVLSNPSNTSVNTSSKGKKGDLKEQYAELLGVSTKDLNPDLYVFIDEWMGSKHRLGGMDKSGIDCSGFVLLAYQEVYNQKIQRSSAEMAEHLKRKYDNQLKEGDLVFFSFGGKNIDHVGIYLHNDKFVHVSTKQGVMISNLKEPWFYRYFTRCGTPK